MENKCIFIQSDLFDISATKQIQKNLNLKCRFKNAPVYWQLVRKTKHLLNFEFNSKIFLQSLAKVHSFYSQQFRYSSLQMRWV